MTYPEWFKPTIAFHVGDDMWIGTGHCAFVTIEPLPEGIRMKGPEGAAMVSRESRFADPRLWERVGEDTGHALYEGGRIFAVHLLDCCMQVHPGIIWRMSRDVPGSAVGFLGERPVAVVMGMRGEMNNGKPCGPECPACDGSGTNEDCDDCDGSGVRECNMGHEHDCDDCDGSGRKGKCAKCGGDGVWKAARS